MSAHNFPYQAIAAPWEIVDPGDAGAFQVDKCGVCNIITAGAETRTLGRPTNAGQWLLLCMDTDGGDAVVTVTGGVNQTGNTTITFADAGECILLFGVKVGGTLRWQAFVVQPESEAPALS